VGARIAGASPLPVSGLTALGPMTARSTPKLLWVNSPSNPTGQVLGVGHLKKVVDWARRHGVVVASDECYAELDWRPRDEADPGGQLTTPCILDPRVCGDSHDGLLAVYSLSKQSNLAGYRAAFVAGDVSLVRRLLEIRRHAGMIVPWPVQQAMLAALLDDAHVAQQKARYAIRRERLRSALEAAGYAVELSDAGLYLWTTGAASDDDCWSMVSALADRGILVAPGSFYGEAGARHVRIALTATDERIEEAVGRLG